MNAKSTIKVAYEVGDSRMESYDGIKSCEEEAVEARKYAGRHSGDITLRPSGIHVR
jgi:hypothetical protein